MERIEKNISLNGLENIRVVSAAVTDKAGDATFYGRLVSYTAADRRERLRDRIYDLVINLEDDLDTGLCVRSLKFKQLFGLKFVNDFDHS